MATAFKALDPAPFTRKPQPNIRVAFSASPAVSAVRQTAAGQGVADQTLEEIAAAVPPLQLLLAERNAIMEQVNTGPEMPEDEQGRVFGEISRLEKAISETPARSTAEAIVKLVAAAQVAAEGHELSDDEAIRALTDAQRYLGVGYIHAQMRPAINPASADGVSDRSWQTATSCLASLKERLAIRGLTDKMVDALADAETSATNMLLALPSRGATDTLMKMRALSALGTMVEVDQLAPLIAELEAFAVGARPEGTDTALAKAHADRRALATEFGASRNLIAAEEDIYWQRLDSIELAVRDNRATTIAGAVIRLRFAFAGLQLKSWSDHALTDPSSATFRDGLKHADMWEQIVWSAIEDLARIGGVQLAEQGR